MTVLLDYREERYPQKALRLNAELGYAHVFCSLIRYKMDEIKLDFNSTNRIIIAPKKDNYSVKNTF